MVREAPLLEEGVSSSTNVQHPLEIVESWVAAAGGGFIQTASSEAAAAGGYKIDALMPELFQLRE